MPPGQQRLSSFETARDKRLRELEEIRLQLPTALYLQILHTAAITGTIPEYDYTPFSGKPPELRPGSSVILDTNDRLKVLTYLVDKALAPLAATKTTEPEVLPNISALPPDTRNLTLNQLLGMVKATAKDAVVTEHRTESTPQEAKSA